MTNPCYNKETKTDCPDRKAGCGGSCTKWLEYEKNRNEGYKAKLKVSASIPFNETSAERKIKYDMRMRGYPRKHDKE